MRLLSMLLLAAFAPLAAQTAPAKSARARTPAQKAAPSTKPEPARTLPPLDSLDPLRQALDADAGVRLRAVINSATTLGLPGRALENRVLMLAARGVPVANIEKSVGEEWARMSAMRDLLKRACSRVPGADEVEAAAELARRGVDAKKIAELANAAPSGRSLAVPLFVVGSFVDLGQPADSVLMRVAGQLAAGASDAEIEQSAAALNAPRVVTDSVTVAAPPTSMVTLDSVRIEEKRETPRGAKGASVPPTRSGPGEPARPTSGAPNPVAPDVPIPVAPPAPTPSPVSPAPTAPLPLPLPPPTVNPGKGKGKKGPP